MYLFKIKKKLKFLYDYIIIDNFLIFDKDRKIDL